ncbi:DUF2516 family protein [Demequina sp.]|uniref:DUF2516 family protein n=1 Tax=Demequina sp. TaxID=2050685 RepID=UPI0025E04DE0|nr:DUF2516 family protein [Demequina sp.]
MFGFLQSMVVFAISAVALIGAIWGLIDAARRSPSAFTAAGKWSKTIWMVILGVATLIAFVSLPWPLGGGGGIAGILGIASVVAVIVYFVDVRPKLGGFGGGSGGGFGGGSRGGSTGGW